MCLGNPCLWSCVWINMFDRLLSKGMKYIFAKESLRFPYFFFTRLLALPNTGTHAHTHTYKMILYNLFQKKIHLWFLSLISKDKACMYSYHVFLVVPPQLSGNSLSIHAYPARQRQYELEPPQITNNFPCWRKGVVVNDGAALSSPHVFSWLSKLITNVGS